MFRKRRRWATVCGLFATGFILAALHIDDFGTTETAKTAGAIVVLGARVREDGSPSPTLRARAAQGAALYKRGLAPIIVFSGGIGVYAPSEASVAAKVAQSNGVPAENCVLEENSHSTRENARFTAQLLRARGISEVIVVSDPYHLRRARWLFEHEGLTVTTSPALEAERHRSASLRAMWTVREIFSLVKDITLTTLGRP